MTKPLIVITGASSGIGASVATLCSQAGHPVALLARNLQAMQALQLPQSICIETDVTDFAALQKAIAQAEAQFGPVDCLINNAGFSKNGDFTELTHADHEHMVNLNVMGVINGIEAVLPGMRARKTGTIINVSSVADRNARPNLSTYAATKAAVKSLTESLRMANAKYGIRICNVAPAQIKTPLSDSFYMDTDPTQIIAVENMANAIVWIYQQPQHVCIRDLVMAPTYYEA